MAYLESSDKDTEAEIPDERDMLLIRSSELILDMLIT